jgi:hypothetical protein
VDTADRRGVNEHVKLVRSLVAAGRRREPRNPSHLAAARRRTHGHLDILKILLQRRREGRTWQKL